MNAAIIVLYNPDEERLKNNVNAVKNQVSCIIFVDNAKMSSIDSFIKEADIEDKAVYINNEGNKGIAYALNRGIEYCVCNGISWALTLDQDSIVPCNMISEYEKYTSNPDIGIICCTINYNDKETYFAGKSDAYAYVDECITSASYIRTSLCEQLGGFDERMFIDRVDFEYCYRLTKKGFKIIQVRDVILAHQLGDLQVEKIGREKIHVGGHSAFRKFYMAQNLVYCHRKHPEKFSTVFVLVKLFKLSAKTLVYEKQKAKKIVAILKVSLNGMKMPVEEENWLRESQQ